MRAFVFAASVCLLSACGAPEDEAQLAIRLDAASRTELGTFQIAVLEDGCGAFTRDCLADTLDDSSALPIRLGEGAEGRVARVTVALTPDSTQSVANLRVPVGRNLGLVIEALSNDSPTRFLGASCTTLPNVSSSRNEAVITNPVVLDADPAVCSKDPNVTP